MLKQYRYLVALLRFAIANNPLLAAIAVLSIVSSVLEILAMTMLLPLSMTVSGSTISPDILAVRLIGYVGAPATGMSFLLAFFILFILRISSQFMVQALTSYVSRQVFLQLTSRAFAALMRNTPLKELEQKSIGYFVSLAGDESFRASTLVSALLQFFTISMLGGLYFLAIVKYSMPVAVATLAFLIVAFFALFETFRISHRLGVRQAGENQAHVSVFLDGFNSLRSVRSFSAENYVVGKYFDATSRYVRTLTLLDVVSQVAKFAPALLLLLMMIGVSLWPFGRSFFSLNLPFLVTMTALLMRFFPVVGQALNLGMKVLADARAGRDVTNIIERRDRQLPVVSNRSHITGPIERIDLFDVNFAHVEGKPVLARFNATFVKGRSYAVIGSSGSGKSTLLDLLLRFYEPDSGRIAINGVSAARIDPADLREKMVLISQETAVFNDTILNNLCFGRPIAETAMEDAARVACLDEFVRNLEGGYQTVLQYRGTNFSGGQKQRIGIARAVLRKPDVLLLDESTSALDGATKKTVVENLISEFSNGTLIFVTHDPYLIDRVDEVIDLSGKELDERNIA